MSNSIDELKRRTNNSDNGPDLEANDDYNLNFHSSDSEQGESVEKKVEKKPVVKNPNLSLNKYHHNPYEEKFHSEFAFVSLILGVFGLILPLFSTLAVIFGIGGLMQTHREHMKGKWMAILGIILGFLGIVIIIVAIIFGIGFLQDYLLKFGGVETLVGAAHVYVN